MCLLFFGISNKGGTTTPRPFPGGGSFCFYKPEIKGEGEISDESRTFGTIKIGAGFR